MESINPQQYFEVSVVGWIYWYRGRMDILVEGGGGRRMPPPPLVSHVSSSHFFLSSEYQISLFIERTNMYCFENTFLCTFGGDKEGY